MSKNNPPAPTPKISRELQASLTYRYPHKKTALHMAVLDKSLPDLDAVYERVKAYLPFFKNVDPVDDFGWTPLQYAACMEGGLDIVKLFIAAGADPNRQGASQDRRTALHLAIDSHNLDIAAGLIRAGVDLTVKDQQGTPPLFYCIRDQHYELLEMLLKAGADPNRMHPMNFLIPLHSAVIAGDLRMVQILLAGGADPEKIDLRKKTPLIIAAIADHPEIVAALLAAGADPERLDSRKQSALHMALRRSKDSDGMYVSAKILMPLMRDLNMADDEGATPLHKAALLSDGAPIVQLLLQAGADPNIRDLDGRSPLHYAARFGAAASVQALLAAGADPVLRDRARCTALFLAAEHGRTEVVSLLTEANPNMVNVWNEDYVMPVHHAAADGNLEILEILIKADATLDDVGYTHQKTTALHLAVARGHIKVVKRLLAAGADTGIRDIHGRTPLELAAEFKNFDMLEVFKRAGVPAPGLYSADVEQTAEELTQETVVEEQLSALQTRHAEKQKTPPRKTLH